GSAVNDATRILGATLGVAIIGSIYASIYASRLTEALPADFPHAMANGAQRSVGAAFGAAAHLEASGHPDLAIALHDAASTAFCDGFHAACLVAAAVSAFGAVLAAALIPAQPPRDCVGELELKHVVAVGAKQD